MGEYYGGGDAELGLIRRLLFGNSFDYTSVDEEFDGSSVPAGWSWATYTGYVTPTEDMNLPSYLRAYFTSDARAFLYRTDMGFTSAHYCRVGINANTTGYMAGMRWDDGTNNNYVECGIRYSSKGLYDVITRIRTGGGNVIETVQINDVVGINTPILIFNPQGTLFSNWNQQLQIRSGAQYQNVFIQNFVTGLTWTPARGGFVCEGLNSSWQWAGIDFYLHS